MTGVSFQECQRVLQLYTEALAGARLELRPTSDLPEETTTLRLDVPTSSAHCIFLPELADSLPSPAENFTLFKVGIVHQVAFRECGTFDFDLEEWRRRSGTGGAPARRDPESTGSDLGDFFSGFARPALARRLFSIFEDARADAWIARRYRGVRADLERLTRLARAGRPDPAALPPADALLESLVLLSLGGEPGDELPVPAQRVEVLRAAMRTVSEAEADVYDSAAAVVACLPLFEDLPRGPRLGRAHERESGETVAAADRAESLDPHGPRAESGGEEGAPPPVSFRGDLRPDLVQKELELEALVQEREGGSEAGSPVPPEVLAEMLAKGGQIEITAAERRELATSSGLRLRDLAGLAGLRREPAEEDREESLDDRIRRLERDLHEEVGDLGSHEAVHYYDEWDFERARYRAGWCRLLETPLPEEDASELDKARTEQARLFAEVRKQFELLRPDTFRKIKRLSDGEDIDLDAAVEAVTDRRAGVSPAEEVYVRRQRRERDVAAAYLLDMSASTDSEVPTEAPARPPAPAYDFVGVFDDDPFWTRGGDWRPPARRRVIDVEKEALLLMAEALEALGDAYGIYGFSGYGRHNVDFFVAKDFQQSFDRRALGRIAGIRPKRSTRMGPPIRHATRKLAAQDARVRVLLILSDGYPQDFDYGRDRTSREYGMRDTMMALREAELRGVHTFCITVDPAGHDYLREMCPESQYLVIDDIAALPRELPKVYRGLTT